MKSHFQFSNQQWSGIFLLVFIIIVVQCAYLFLDFSKVDSNVDTSDIIIFKSELDSLRQLEIQNRKPKIYSFNPNYITDFKGATLGMSNEEIDRLLAFRGKNQWINSVKQFQQVTKISDSLLNQISPYFKFPEWVTNPMPKINNNSLSFSKTDKPKTYEQKQDLNTATAAQLKKVYGVGEKLSERIITYRSKHEGGFASEVELSEIYGLSPETITQITNHFVVKTPRPIKRLNLNDANVNQLVTIRYIDYEIADAIIEERTLRQGFKSLEELTKVEDFPIHKIEIIKLYLQLK